jgi:hypothetical protein
MHLKPILPNESISIGRSASMRSKALRPYVDS